jgi:ribosomal protein S18 acetylase RimI-like enzyme
MNAGESRVIDYVLVPAKAEDQPWLERLRRHLRHCAECWQRGAIYLVEAFGACVGMIQLFDGGDAIEIGEIQIEPTYQGRGLGTQLLQDTIDRAHANDKKVRLTTGLKNHRAFKLYQRLGFRRVKQTDTHDHMECPPDLRQQPPS